MLSLDGEPGHQAVSYDFLLVSYGQIQNESLLRPKPVLYLLCHLIMENLLLWG